MWYDDWEELSQEELAVLYAAAAFPGSIRPSKYFTEITGCADSVFYNTVRKGYMVFRNGDVERYYDTKNGYIITQKGLDKVQEEECKRAATTDK